MTALRYVAAALVAAVMIGAVVDAVRGVITVVRWGRKEDQ